MCAKVPTTKEYLTKLWLNLILKFNKSSKLELIIPFLFTQENFALTVLVRLSFMSKESNWVEIFLRCHRDNPLLRNLFVLDWNWVYKLFLTSKRILISKCWYMGGRRRESVLKERDRRCKRCLNLKSLQRLLAWKVTKSQTVSTH